MYHRRCWQLYQTLPHPRIWSLVLLLALGVLRSTLALAEVRIDAREIVTILPKDAIPAILDPKPMLVPASEAVGVRDSDQVLGVTIGTDSRAYPIPFLSWHEIVNDTIGGVPVAVTW
jgi:hypothetical protein